MANKQCCLVVVLLPLSVWAQQPNYLDEMAKIDAQIAYVQKQNDLKAALLKSSNTEGMPRILSILVDEKGAAAQILYRSGIIRWVKKGDLLLDGMIVLAIGKSSVLVGGRGGKFSLAFAAPNTDQNSQQQQPGNLPPLPNIKIPMPLPPAITPPQAVAPAAASVNAAANPVAGK